MSKDYTEKEINKFRREEKLKRKNKEFNKIKDKSFQRKKQKQKENDMYY